MVTGHSKYKMIYALNMMSVKREYQHRHKCTSYQYAYIRKNIQLAARKTSAARRWVNKNGIVKNIHVDELPTFIDAGWHRGRAQKKEKSLVPKKSTKGKTYEEIYGYAEAKRLKEGRSKALKGRIFSADTKKLWSKNRKGTNTRGHGSNAIPVTIDNVTYACKLDACDALGLSMYFLNKQLTGK
jgi:hypothetical protein